MVTSTGIPVQTVEQLTAAANEIQAFLEAEFNSDVPAAVLDRANSLASYMALTGKMVADAKWHYNQQVESSFMHVLKVTLKEANSASIGTSTINKFIDSLARDYDMLFRWCDRLNRSCTHQLDLMRSLISKNKEEFKVSNYHL